MKFVLSTVLLLLAALALAACGGGDDDSESAETSARAQDQSEVADEQAEDQTSDEEPPPPPRAASEDEPAADESSFEFEERELVSLANPSNPDSRLGAVIVAVPVDWAEDPGFWGLFSPPDNPFRAQLSAGSTCGGGCVQRTEAEWAETAQETEFAQFRDEENFEIEVEEDLADGKLLVATSNLPGWSS